MRKALLIIDPINDFFSGGALSVPNGEKIFPAINRMIDYAETEKNNWLIVVCRDSHLKESVECQKYGLHAIRNTWGAELHPDLKIDEDAVITIFKGIVVDELGYSGFGGINADGFSLSEILNKTEIERLYISGVATEVCVKDTVLDALKAGFKVTVLSDAIAPFNIAVGERALYEMRKAGAVIMTAWEVVIRDYR